MGWVAGSGATSALPPALRCPHQPPREDEMSFRVVVDFDKCESNALCMGVAPEVFEVRDDDFLYVLQEEPPDELRAKCEEAVRVCPKQAITIVDA
jgi:ferredoxin